MKRKVTWTAEARTVPALKHVIADGAVKNGDDISSAPLEVLTQLIEQGLAAEDVPAVKKTATK